MRVIKAILLSFFLVQCAQVMANTLAFEYRSPDGSVILSNSPLGAPFTLIKSQPWAAYSDFSIDGPVADPMHDSIAKRKNDYLSIVTSATRQHKIDAALIHAVIEAESAYQPKVVSHAGAIGLMQLMPGTAERYKVTDPVNPEQNVMGGAEYLKYLLGYYKNNLKLAVAAYNAGEGAVDKYGKAIPPYPETRQYVKRVFSIYRRNLAATKPQSGTNRVSMTQ